jgi:hypothetical protein
MSPLPTIERIPPALARGPIACKDARPMHAHLAHVELLTSARMAAGMTSRARRPELRMLAG